MKSPLKSFVRTSNFQTVIFAIMFVTMNGHTSKLFKNIFYDVQTEEKVGVIRLNIPTSKLLFDTIYDFNG